MIPTDRNFRAPYQILCHGLCSNINGEAAELRGVLKLTVKCPQVHWKNVIFGKCCFLESKILPLILIQVTLAFATISSKSITHYQ